MSDRNAFEIGKTGGARKATGYPQNWPSSPGPTFISDAELNFIANINDELIENIVGQSIRYYRISRRKTDFNDLYDEAIVKSFEDPITLYARISFEGEDVSTGRFTIDKNQTLELYFHARRLQEMSVTIREGDFFEWDQSGRLFEIIRVTLPLFIGGFPLRDKGGPMGTHAFAKLSREGLFDGL